MKITSFKFFYPERPRLIHVDQPLFQELSDKQEFIAERKYNGSRLQLHCLDGNYQFWNRHNEQMAYQPSEEIVEKLNSLDFPGYCVFDGELRNNKVVGVKGKIILYDCFIWHNELLTGKPFWWRRNILKSLFKCNAEPVGITEQFPDNFKELFYQVIEDKEIEGLVIKSTRGMLNLSRTSAVNSNWMFKVRKPNNSYRF